MAVASRVVLHGVARKGRREKRVVGKNDRFATVLLSGCNDLLRFKHIYSSMDEHVRIDIWSALFYYI